MPPLNRLSELVEWLPRKGGNFLSVLPSQFIPVLIKGVPELDGHVTVLKYLWEEVDKGLLPW